MKTSERIYTTTMYSQFKKVRGNRQPKEHSIIKIAKSMENFGYVGSPIIVNKELKIIDGQHRLEACRLTKTPVEYIIRPYGDNEMKILNSIKLSWTKYDSLEQYVTLGDNDYKKLKSFMTKDHEWLSHNIGIAGALMCDGEANWYRKSYYKNNKRIWVETFKNGDWKIKSYSYAKKFTKYIEDIHKYYEYAYSRSFVAGILTLEKRKDFKFNKQRFLNKIKKYKGQMKDIKISNNRDFIRFMNSVYNINLDTYEERIKF